MKQIVHLFLIVLSLYTGVSQGQEIASLTTNILEIDTYPYRLPILNNTKGYLEKTKISVGTIIKSHHFSKYDHHDYNESHNGVYININKWSAGTYMNSSDKQSTFITYNTNLYRKKSFMINLVTGVASGYEDWEYAQGDYLPVLGASAQWSFLKAMLSYDVVAFGIELPVN